MNTFTVEYARKYQALIGDDIAEDFTDRAKAERRARYLSKTLEHKPVVYVVERDRRANDVALAVFVDGLLYFRGTA